MTMKKLFALALVGLASVASAQTPVGVQFTDDTGIAMLVRYVGSNSSATVAVDAGTGDLTFQVGGSAYTGFECPVAGALGGIIDVSNAACNTMAEVVDTINGSCTGCSSDFRAVLIDSLRTDTSTDAIVTIGATQVTRTDGLQLNIDTSVALIESRALIPNRTNIAGYLGGPATGFRLLENPYAGQWPFLRWFEGFSTYGAGTSSMSVYSVKPSNKVSGAETVSTLWGPEAMGATTVNKQFTYWQNNLLPGRRNEKLIVRVTNTNAMATTGGFANAEVRSAR
jgi:hypothetical protein